MLYAREMPVSRYCSPVITRAGRQRLLRPSKIRDTAFVGFQSSHAWVKVVHTHILQSLIASCCGIGDGPSIGGTMTRMPLVLNIMMVSG